MILPGSISPEGQYDMALVSNRTGFFVRRWSRKGCGKAAWHQSFAAKVMPLCRQATDNMVSVARRGFQRPFQCWCAV